MPKNLFSAMVRGEVDNWRRIGHSASDYVRSIDRSSLGLVSTPEQVINAAGLFAGTAGGVAGGIALGMSQAAAGAVAGAGFLAAIAGPQVAVTSAVVGLVFLVKGTYSNREAAHRALYDYTWNMVDDQPPTKGLRFTKEELESACDAAATLLDDGKNQIKLLGTKLQEAEKKFTQELAKLEKLYVRYETEMFQLKRLGASNLSSTELLRIRAEFDKLWKKETKSGGAIFNYVRRLSHTGNYIQAAHLVALGMKSKWSADEVFNVDQPDYFGQCEFAKKLRSSFAAMTHRYADLVT